MNTPPDAARIQRVPLRNVSFDVPRRGLPLCVTAAARVIVASLCSDGGGFNTARSHDGALRAPARRGQTN
eukprot:1088477-Alexandrium_andersonii.AAC.1